jgi:hypothetical protein
VTLAHIAGVPFEEWLTPLAATGGGIVFALRAAFRRPHRRGVQPRARLAESSESRHADWQWSATTGSERGDRRD